MKQQSIKPRTWLKRFATREELLAFDVQLASDNYHTIGTHVNPHADEAVAIMFIRDTHFGQEMFPGIEKAKIVYGFDDKGLPAVEWAKQGVLLVGIGDNNPLNEHSVYSHECAASLATKLLDIDRMPFVQQVMRYARFTDTKGDLGFQCYAPGDNLLLPNIFLPGSQIKNFYREAKPLPQVKATYFENWIMQFFADYKGDYRVHTEGKEEFANGEIVWEGRAKLSVREVARREQKNLKFLKTELLKIDFEKMRPEDESGQKELMQTFQKLKAKILALQKEPEVPTEDTYKVFFVRSDSEYVLKYTLLVDKKIGVIIQRHKNGHFQIHKNNRFDLSLREVAAVLRRMHQDAKRNTLTTDFALLKSGGVVPGAEDIYFDEEKTGGIFNATTTHPDVAPSPLRDESIIAAVKIGLGNSFRRSHAAKCQTGICPHKSGNYCDWYRYGLFRCIAVRRAQYNGISTTSVVPRVPNKAK